MKLKTALELGKECDFETVGECIDNAEIHAHNLFIYELMGKELVELFGELEASMFTRDTPIDVALATYTMKG